MLGLCHVDRSVSGVETSKFDKVTSKHQLFRCLDKLDMTDYGVFIIKFTLHHILAS